MAAPLEGALAEQTWNKSIIIFNKSKFEHTSELFTSSKILNINKLKVFNIAAFMYKVKGKSAPCMFLSKFRKPAHSYSTRFFNQNYVKLIPNLNKPKYGISCRWSFVWNNFLGTTDKQIIDVARFKSVIKSKLLSLENEVNFF